MLNLFEANIFKLLIKYYIFDVYYLWLDDDNFIVDIVVAYN